jgi:excisionase family DNA binding protein
MLALHPSEVRALVEDGRLDAVRVGGRWLISRDSVQRLDAARKAPDVNAPDPDLHSLEARVAELEQRLESLEGAQRADARPRRQYLIR